MACMLSERATKPTRVATREPAAADSAGGPDAAPLPRFSGRRVGSNAYSCHMPPRRRIRAFVGIVLLACGFWSYVLLRRSPEPQEEKRTIVLTAYETQGLRPAWLRQIVEQYASEDYADLIDAILLVWNAPEEEPPADLPAKVQVIRAAANSLNNR